MSYNNHQASNITKMKKQVLRLKQFADQTFNRSGKTEILTDTLLTAEKRAEYLKSSCCTVSKKLANCHVLGQQPEPANKEKALKKSPVYQLGSALLDLCEGCAEQPEDDSLRQMFARCGESEKELADNSFDHYTRVDELVITKLHTISEWDLAKHKRNVTKACADVETARARLQQSQQRQTSGGGGGGKVETMKEEFEDCELKVEQSRDVFACELFELLSKKSNVCHTLLDYYQLQASYHKFALGVYEKLIPELQTLVTKSKVCPVYGVPLKEHLDVTGRTIAEPIEVCTAAIAELGMQEEGLFRLTGSASKVKRLKLAFDAGLVVEEVQDLRDPHILAGALKSYLRELPQPLLTFHLYKEWLQAAREQDKVAAIERVLRKLPTENYNNLEYLIKFFRKLCRSHESNKMSAHNVAIVVAPSLMWAEEDEGWNMIDATVHSAIVDTLLNEPSFFPGELELPTLNLHHGNHGGIDNKAFDIHLADRTHARNHSDHGVPELKRSQSTNSLDDQHHQSPKPVSRRKRAPEPPSLREKQKAEETPSKPPRPQGIPPHTSTLPRQAKTKRENKATETDSDEQNLMTQSVGPELETLLKASKRAAKSTKSVSTNTEGKVRPDRPVAAPRSTLAQPPEGELREEKEDAESKIFNRKKEWLFGKESDSCEVELRNKPVIPSKPQSFKVSRPLLDTNLRNTYENVSVSSNENLSGGSSDERTLKKTQMYSIDKKQVAIIHVGPEGKENKEARCREKRGREGSGDEQKDKDKELEQELKQDEVEDEDDADVRVFTTNNSAPRPTSLPGSAKPERPPKPGHMATSPPPSSHHRTFSDGECPRPAVVASAAEKSQGPSLEEPGKAQAVPAPHYPTAIKHPRVSPPPPPVPAKPRVNSNSDSTDF